MNERRQAILTPMGTFWLPVIWFAFWALAFGMIAHAVYDLWAKGITPATATIGGASAAWGYITIRYYNQFCRWIDGDELPQVTHGRYILRIELATNNGANLEYLHTPEISADRLQEMAAAIVKAGGLTSALGERVFGSRPDYEEFRAEIIRRGWAAWRNPTVPTKGIEITALGLEAFARIAEGGELIEIEEE